MDYNVHEYEYKNRTRNLKVEALGKVKSEKFFPVFEENGDEYIFKPLSKTKPFLTPLFAYSEVYWSNIIQKYFDDRTPKYRLAICHGYSKDVPKYRDKGTIVSKIERENERLVNLYQLFKENPDEKVDIENYINYCGMFYDYTNILQSDFFKENQNLAKELANQILISILKGDINYHYENVLILYKDDKPVSIAPSIDHEFSVMFYCLDYLHEHIFYFSELLEGINFEVAKDNQVKSINIEKNLDFIIDNYPDVAKDFFERLQNLKDDIKYCEIGIKDNGYIEPFNSYEFMIGQAKYKENDNFKAEIIDKEIDRNCIDIKKFSKSLNKEVLNVIDSLQKTLSKRLKGKTKCL